MKTEEKIDIHLANLKKWRENLDQSKISKKNKDLILLFLDDASIGKHNPRLRRKNKSCGKRRICKMAYCLKNLASWFNKDFNKIIEKDVTQVVKKIESEDYEDTTKADYKVVLIQFLRWLYKNAPKKFHTFTDWICIDIKKKEIPFLKEYDIERMLKACRTTKQKVLVAFLFDSGARVEEFLNIRLGDLIEVKENPPYFRVTIREEFSKTKGRTIGLYWKYTTQLIKDWLEQHPNKNDLSVPFYPSTYDGCRVLLYKIALRSIGRKINPHLLRHSSATFYASKLNRYQLCKRYGWSFSSKMPSVYINRAGIDEKEVSEKFKEERLADLNLKMQRLEEQNKSLRESDKIFAEKMMQFLDIFKNNPKAAQIIAKQDTEKLKEILS